MYVYIGEKVPWLIIQQLLPMMCLAVYLMTNRKAAVAIGMSAFLIIMTLHVAFDPGDISEPIVQVQNSEDMRVGNGLDRRFEHHGYRLKGLLASPLVLPGRSVEQDFRVLRGASSTQATLYADEPGHGDHPRHRRAIDVAGRVIEEKDLQAGRTGSRYYDNDKRVAGVLFPAGREAGEHQHRCVHQEPDCKPYRGDRLTDRLQIRDGLLRRWPGPGYGKAGGVDYSGSFFCIGLTGLP